MFCVRCGTGRPEGAAFCPSCGTAVAATGDASGEAARLPPGVAATGAGIPAEPFAAPAARDYGGFWRRFWSYLLDRFILGLLFTPVGLLALVPRMTTSSTGWTDSGSPAPAITTLMGGVASLVLFALLGSWLYYAILQSSAKQATLGQLALGIRLTDLEGRRVSFARASGRHLATLLTGLTFGIGYLIMLFTARKQTLHDLLAGTLVLR